MQITREQLTNSLTAARRPGEFFSKLSAAALNDLESMEFPTLYPANMILFTEKQTPAGIYIVVSGEVKLSMNSADGKRLIVRIAKAGELLGISSVISGVASEVTAETLHPAKIAVIERAEFLGYLRRHPEVYQILTVELSRHLNMVYEQLRTVGLSGSAPEKLARLLLDWSEKGQTTPASTSR